MRAYFTWYISTLMYKFQYTISLTHKHTHLSQYQTALFVIVEIHLLSFVKDESNYSRDTNKSARHALLIFTYTALFFCLSATVSGLILTDEFGELPVRASRKKDPIQEGVFDSGALDLLRSYGAKPSWIWVMWHCEFPVRSLNPLNDSSSLSMFMFMFMSYYYGIALYRVVLPHRRHHFSDHTITPLHLARRIQFGENNSHVHFAFRRSAFIAPCTAPPRQR